MCVMSEKIVHQLGLVFKNPSIIKEKMAKNMSIDCVVGKIKKVKITVCGIEVAVDMYVLPSKGEGHSIILGRLWLIAIKARQD